MTRPSVSVVILAEGDGHRLELTLKSVLSACAVAGVESEIVLAMGEADAETRGVAQALLGPGERASLASAASTRSAAEIAWGETVVLCRCGDLLSPSYIGAVLTALATTPPGGRIVRPSTCVGYGATPYVFDQKSLAPQDGDRAHAIFRAPFRPPVAAARRLLLDLPERGWDLAQDWAWTIETLSRGVDHSIADAAVYLEWTGERSLQVLLPAPTAKSEVDPLQASETQRRSLAQLRSALIDADARAEEAQQRAKALENSASWRITRPLRALRSLLSRRRGP